MKYDLPKASKQNIRLLSAMLCDQGIGNQFDFSILQRIDSMKSTPGISQETNLKWIQHQLANDFQIELDVSDIWRATYNNSDRNIGRANSMLVELANDKVTLSRFAQTLNTSREKVVVVNAGPRSVELFILSLLMFFIGLTVGAIL